MRAIRAHPFRQEGEAAGVPRRLDMVGSARIGLLSVLVVAGACAKARDVPDLDGGGGKAAQADAPVDSGNAPNGTNKGCGEGRVCRDGGRVACMEGMACEPAPCRKGAITCTGVACAPNLASPPTCAPCGAPGGPCCDDEPQACNTPGVACGTGGGAGLPCCPG
jgi:hypothetical protein